MRGAGFLPAPRFRVLEGRTRGLGKGRKAGFYMSPHDNKELQLDSSSCKKQDIHVPKRCIFWAAHRQSGR
jgi:hypothetical protein